MKKNAATSAYLAAFYEKNRLCCFSAALLYILDALSMLVISWLLGAVLDTISAAESGELLHLVWVSAVILAAMLAVGLLLQLTKNRFVCTGICSYRSLVFTRLTRKNISAFARESTSSYLSALTNDANSIETDYLEKSLGILRFGVMFVSSLAMMFWYHWKLALFAVLLSLLPMVVSLSMGGEMARRDRALSDQNGEFVARVKDILSGFAVIKSFRAEEQSKELFEKANVELRRVKFRRRMWAGLLSTIGQFCGSIVQIGVFFLCGLYAIKGEITAGTVVVFVNLCNFVIAPIQYLPEYWGARKAALGLVKKMSELNRQNLGHSGKKVDPELKEGIAFQNLGFGYEPDKPVLKDVSLRLEPGKAYAVVGASGSGKSTLLRLLMGAYDQYEGSLTIDGQELRESDPDSLYDLMSLVGQEVFIFDNTIRDNITMFGSFPPEKVDEAARQAGLDRVMRDRGEGYRCGENGVNLSGGERQRIAIARALLRGSTVLLADEATAALDAETAKTVTDSILNLNGLTRVVVTHRLEPSALSRYDQIIVMKNGRICEQGGYRELMEAKNQFYALSMLANG